MQLNRYLYRCFKILYKCGSLIRCEQRSHILDAQRFCSGSFYTLCIINIILMSEYLACGIADSYLCVAALFIRCLNGSFKISYIVKCVKDPYYVNTVCNRFLNEIFNQIVCVVTITQHILSSEKHLKLGIWHLSSDYPQSFPRVLIEKSYTGVKSCSSPYLSRIKADFIKLRKNIYHVIYGHSCCKQGLVCVTKYGFCYIKLCHYPLCPFVNM